MSANESIVETARSILELDCRATEALIPLLREERSALETRDAGKLNNAVQRKLEWLQQLERNDQLRKRLLRQRRSTDWPTLLNSLDPNGKLGFTRDWAKLKRSLEECAELSTINDRIVRRTRRSIDRIVALLRGQSDPVGVYDRLGKTHGYGDNRAITSA